MADEKTDRSSRSVHPNRTLTRLSCRDPQWLSTLERGGGGAALARTWFLYWGAIPHDWITEFRDMRAGTSFSWPAMRVAAAELAAAAEGGR